MITLRSSNKMLQRRYFIVTGLALQIFRHFHRREATSMSSCLLPGADIRGRIDVDATSLRRIDVSATSYAY